MARATGPPHKNKLYTIYQLLLALQVCTETFILTSFGAFLKVVLITFIFVYSLAIHPNKEIIASGQVAGHAKKEGKVKKWNFLLNINS